MKRSDKVRQAYPSDLTDAQWAVIEPLYSGMRTYKWSKRELTNAVLYFVKTGCQRRYLPHDFPPCSTVHSFCRRACLSGLWEKILQHLVKTSREKAGSKAEPSYAILDSQSVKTTGAAKERGIDGGKKRKAGSGTSSQTHWEICWRWWCMPQISTIQRLGSCLQSRHVRDIHPLNAFAPMRDTGGLLRLMPVRLWGVVLIFLRKSSLTNERSFPGAGLWSGHLPGSIIPASLVRAMRY